MAEPLWKGRFSKPPDAALMDLSASIEIDRRLWREDILATSAHAKVLQKGGLLTAEEEARISACLAEAADALENNRFEVDPADEDIHSAIERFLTFRLGDLGAKIHAGRSRNDLVVTDLRLWLKVQTLEICDLILAMQDSLLAQAAAHRETLMPGYTHLQRAQPVVLAHHLLAHLFALSRDFERMVAAYRTTDVCCLGAAAFAGSTLPVDPYAAAGELGFSRVFDNSADAVADRDFALEFLAASAILGVHLSRLAEEIVLWTSAEFGFAALDDSYATGSSIMPQKKNPDVAELVRSKSARLTANLVHLLGVLKGLPLTYNRDLQEDKQAVFDAVESLKAALPALAGAIRSMVFDAAKMQSAAESGNAAATDLAEALVWKGVPFRSAHEAIGKLVAAAAAAGKQLSELSGDELSAAHPQLTNAMLGVLDPRTSVNAKSSHGGTSPERVSEQIAAAGDVIKRHQRWLEEARAPS